MAGIARRARQILYHRYPDRWLDAGFAIFLGLFMGLMALLFTRDMSSSLDESLHALYLWSVTLCFFVSATALLFNRRWGYIPMAGLFLLAAVFFAREWQLLAAGLCFMQSLYYYQRYHASW